MSNNNNYNWLWVSDVDDTILGDDTALVRLTEALNAAPDGLTITYNSSRPCASLRKSLSQYDHMKTPDFLIGAMGTEIQDGPSGEPLEDYGLYLRQQGWDRSTVADIVAQFDLDAHSNEYQTPYKASYHCPSAEIYEQIKAQVAAVEGLAAKVIFSGGKNLDIIPTAAGKGNVIAYLRRRLKVAPENVVVSGDSGNDLEMFVAPYRGIVVGNADKDLKSQQGDNIYHATATHAGGVLEGLRHWQVLS